MEARSLSREAIKNKEEVQCLTLLELSQKYSAEKRNNTAEFSKSVVFTSKQILFFKNNTIQQSQSNYGFSHWKKSNYCIKVLQSFHPI